ncbi:hypothetical protein [Helicobacter canis]|nr:hypothetical protein [Helicobacter canis]
MIAQHSASEKVDSSDTALFLSLRDTAKQWRGNPKDTHTKSKTYS